MDLDSLLDASAGPIAARTELLHDEVRALVSEIELMARPRRPRLRALAVGGIATGALTLGAAGAMATGIVPGPAWVGGWTTDSGGSCVMEFWATPAGPDGEPLSRTYSRAEKVRAVGAARSFLSTFDVASIDKAAAIRDWQRGESAAIAREPASEKQPRLHGDDLEITAVGQAVWLRVDAYLASKGIPAELVVPSQSWRCPR